MIKVKSHILFHMYLYIYFIFDLINSLSFVHTLTFNFLKILKPILFYFIHAFIFISHSLLQKKKCAFHNMLAILPSLSFFLSLSTDQKRNKKDLLCHSQRHWKRKSLKGKEKQGRSSIRKLIEGKGVQYIHEREKKKNK